MSSTYSARAPIHGLHGLASAQRHSGSSKGSRKLLDSHCRLECRPATGCHECCSAEIELQILYLEAAQCAQQVWMIAVSNNLPDRDAQLQALIAALLSNSCMPEAHQVRILFHAAAVWYALTCVFCMTQYCLFLHV